VLRVRGRPLDEAQGRNPNLRRCSRDSDRNGDAVVCYVLFRASCSTLDAGFDIHPEIGGHIWCSMDAFRSWELAGWWERGGARGDSEHQTEAPCCLSRLLIINSCEIDRIFPTDAQAQADAIRYQDGAVQARVFCRLFTWIRRPW
jgi:hypothetical protein